MEKGLLYALVIIAVAILIGLVTNIWSCGPVPVEGLLLVDGTGSIGSSDGNSSTYTYSFTLFNSDREDIYITTVEPVLVQSPYIISSSDSLRREINELLVAGSSMTIEGRIELDTTNVSKEEIAGFKPILYVNVSSTQTIPYFTN